MAGFWSTSLAFRLSAFMVHLSWSLVHATQAASPTAIWVVFLGLAGPAGASSLLSLSHPAASRRASLQTFLKALCCVYDLIVSEAADGHLARLHGCATGACGWCAECAGLHLLELCQRWAAAAPKYRMTLGSRSACSY